MKDKESTNDDSNQSQKEKLVLIHGYGQSSALYFPILKQLAKYFDIFLFDIVGMGASSRPDDFDRTKFTPAKVNEYFNEYFEKWRNCMKHVLTRLYKPKEYYQKA